MIGSDNGLNLHMYVGGPEQTDDWILEEYVRGRNLRRSMGTHVWSRVGGKV